MNGARLTFKFVVVGNDDAALTGSHQFAGLETEGAGNTESPDALSAPLPAVSVSPVRKYDLVSNANSQARHGHFQSSCSVRYCNSVPGAMKGRESRLEFQGLGPRGSPPHAALQDVLECLLLFVVVMRPRRKRFPFRFWTTKNC